MRIIKYLYILLISLAVSFNPQSGIRPKFHRDINKRFKQYTNEEMQTILKQIILLQNKDKNDLTKEVREITRSAYHYLQRNTYKDIYYLGWIPFYNEDKKVYNTPYYFIFLDKVPIQTIYIDYIFQSSLWFDIYKKAHVNNFLFFDDLITFANVKNYTLNADKLNLNRFHKFKLAAKYDMDVFYK